jgi:hypothetical protein
MPWRESDVQSRCSRCGTNAWAGPEARIYELVARGGPDAESLFGLLCGPCARDFPGESQRAEYVRLGLLA